MLFLLSRLVRCAMEQKFAFICFDIKNLMQNTTTKLSREILQWEFQTIAAFLMINFALDIVKYFEKEAMNYFLVFFK